MKKQKYCNASNFRTDVLRPFLLNLKISLYSTYVNIQSAMIEKFLFITKITTGFSQCKMFLLFKLSTWIYFVVNIGQEFYFMTKINQTILLSDFV
jgi:hypothetical protein